jgi:palmitoyltransferase
MLGDPPPTAARVRATKLGEWVADRCFDCVDHAVYYVGPLFVCIAVTLISGCYYGMYTAVLPYNHAYASPAGLAHAVWFTWLAFNIMFNYVSAATVDPGRPDPALTEGALAEDGLTVDDVRAEEPPRKGHGFARYCRRCEAGKPARTHHCHICGRCVLRLDHHCPWIANCVGHHNHRNFVLFLWYLWVGCAYAQVMCYTPAMVALAAQGRSRARGGAALLTAADGSTPVDENTVLLTCLVTMVFLLAMSALGGWQVYLVLSNQTTIEFYGNRTEASAARLRGEAWFNPYDLGSRRNFALFMGGPRWPPHWVLPARGIDTTPPDKRRPGAAAGGRWGAVLGACLRGHRSVVVAAVFFFFFFLFTFLTFFVIFFSSHSYPNGHTAHTPPTHRVRIGTGHSFPRVGTFMGGGLLPL